MNALIYGQSGAGKTVNSTRVTAPNRGKNLLICSDNSSVVLGQFKRPNLTIANVNTAEEFVKTYREAVAEKKYDNIILDNLSDLFDMWILELAESDTFKDIRQAYQFVYQNLKRLTRESAAAQCNTIFTAWSENVEVTVAGGERVTRLQPKLPLKIIDNICGLCNVVGIVVKGEKDWGYILEGSPKVMAKDQIGCRQFCTPEDIFNGGTK